MKKIFAFALLVLFSSAAALPARADHSVYDLACENKTDPVPVAVQLPRFSWKIPLKAQISEPLKVRDRLPVVRSFKNTQGRWVYDFGQNFSGYIQVRMEMKGRQSVQFHPAELLEEGNLVHQGHSGKPVWFSYTSEEAGRISWHPQFTYYGFRYVEVEGAVPAGEDNPGNLPEILSLEGCHTCNSASEVGHFECSKPIFNQTFQLIDWAIRSNMRDTPEWGSAFVLGTSTRATWTTV